MGINISSHSYDKWLFTYTNLIWSSTYAVFHRLLTLPEHLSSPAFYSCYMQRRYYDQIAKRNWPPDLLICYGKHTTYTVNFIDYCLGMTCDNFVTPCETRHYYLECKSMTPRAQVIDLFGINNCSINNWTSLRGLATLKTKIAIAMEIKT